MNLPNKLTITRIILVPILILIYMFPYAESSFKASDAEILARLLL